MSGNSKQQVQTLYAEHHGWLFGWLRGKLGNSSDAADLAHDTFLRVMVARRPVDALEPRALLTHIAKGLVIDHWRRREIERAYLDALSHLPQAHIPSSEQQLIVVETLVRIDTVLSTLPAQTREMFLLAQIEGLTLSQISEKTHTPVVTVRRHIRKALLACMTVE